MCAPSTYRPVVQTMAQWKTMSYDMLIRSELLKQKLSPITCKLAVKQVFPFALQRFHGICCQLSIALENNENCLLAPLSGDPNQYQSQRYLIIGPNVPLAFALFPSFPWKPVYPLKLFICPAPLTKIRKRH